MDGVGSSSFLTRKIISSLRSLFFSKVVIRSSYATGEGASELRYTSLIITIDTEGKTGGKNVLMVNKAAYKALQNYFMSVGPQNEDYLFPSRKTKKPMTISAVNALVKKWTRTINLKGNYGAHTLRKTFGYVQRTVFSVGFEVLVKRYNHASPAVTMFNLGITDKEVSRVLLNEI